jgi:hypothetical protein
MYLNLVKYMLEALHHIVKHYNKNQHMCLIYVELCLIYVKL